VVFSGYSVSSTNKTDHHDITEILLKVALSTINQINYVIKRGGFKIQLSRGEGLRSSYQEGRV
jgi:hypothetical protein